MDAKFSSKAVLIDLAGVMHTRDDPLPGAVRALDRLRASGLPLRFLTNTTRTLGHTFYAVLQRMGFSLARSEIQTAALAARTLVRSRKLRPLWLVHPDIAGEMSESAADPDIVVLGEMGPHFTYPIVFGRVEPGDERQAGASLLHCCGQRDNWLKNENRTATPVRPAARNDGVSSRPSF